MNSRKETKLIREGPLVAEVEVELTDFDRPWGPYLSVQDADRLDRVRDALRRSDVAGAGKLARVFRLVPAMS